MENKKIKKVVVVPYTANWAAEFEKLKSVFQNYLKTLICNIEHVGSTAVPGLSAKPIIDIDIIISNKEKFDEIKSILRKLGYTYSGQMGIPGREAFKRDDQLTPMDGSGYYWHEHHLYVCVEDSDSLKNHLLLRDYLRANLNEAQDYGRLKIELAAKYPDDIDHYVEGKTAFILQILKKSDFDQEVLSQIELQNKAVKS